MPALTIISAAIRLELTASPSIKIPLMISPVFGVIFSGALMLRKSVGPNLILTLILVSMGMVLVNQRPSDHTGSEKR